MIYPKSLNSVASLTLHVFCIPAFLLMSILLYEPRVLCDLLHAGEGSIRMDGIYTFNIAIVCAIVLVAMLLCRGLFLLLRRSVSFTMPYYAAWCVAEVLFMSSFVALYLTLMDRGANNYFYYLGNLFRFFASLLVYPYVIIAQVYYAHALPSSLAQDEGRRMRFYDNRHLLKFTAPSSSILYIEANENYLIIHYTENDRVRSYELRNSMKSIEDLCTKSGFVRTHRSFFVNPSKVKMVVKGDMGRYFAKFDIPDSPEIPVTKKNYESLMSLM